MCKTERCPICGNKGSIQVFFNKQNEIKYVRVRHYTGLNEAKKPQFSYYVFDYSQSFSVNLSFVNKSLFMA